VSVRVLVVDDHELLAQSLTAALRAEGLDVVRATSFEPDAVLAAAVEGPADVVLLDLWLSGSETSLPLIGPLRGLGCSVVMVTGEADRMLIAACVEAGAVGLVAKSEPFESLVASVLEVADHRTLLTDAQRDDLLRELRISRAANAEVLAPFERLTRREAAVLQELIEGHSAEAIAAAAFVSITTVRAQIRSILTKLDVSSQLAAVSAARRAGWTP
jgi:DNA-binding NarL/FixJ family response regulator